MTAGSSAPAGAAEEHSILFERDRIHGFRSAGLRFTHGYSPAPLRGEED